MSVAWHTELLNHHDVHLKLIEHCVSTILKKKKKKRKAGQGCGLEDSRTVASEANVLAQSQGWQSQKLYLRDINRCMYPLLPLTLIKHVIIYLTK